MDPLSRALPVTAIAASTKIDEAVEKLAMPPAHAGAAVSSEKLEKNVGKLAKKQMPGGLEQLVNNAEATLKMTGKALAIVGKEWVGNLSEGDTFLIFPRFLASTIGALLYGGSILACAAIKAALWLPIIGITAVAGGAVGFIPKVIGFLLSLSGDEKEREMGEKFSKAADAMARFTSDLVGGTLASFTSIAAAATVIPRGALWCIGALGLVMMTRWDPDRDDPSYVPQEDIQFKLFAGLYQTLQDSLGLWSGYQETIWADAFPVDRHVNAHQLKMLLDMGANVNAMQGKQYTLASKLTRLKREEAGGEIERASFGKELLEKAFVDHPEILRKLLAHQSQA